MRAVYGQFTVEGAGAPPWSADDERRLRGGWPRVDTPPHVMTLGGPFVLGRVRLPVPSEDQLVRVLAMGVWAESHGNEEAAAFYAKRAADISVRLAAASVVG